MTTKNRADDLAMLLSTDWFFGAWGVLGLSSTSKDRLAIRDGCRLVVNDVLGESDDYWEADFSPARLEKTAQHLISLFSSDDVDNHDQTTITRLTHGIGGADGLGPEASLATNLIWLLISEYRLNEEMRTAVSESAFEHIEAAALSASDSEDLIVRLGSVQSTEWDERLKRATTDNPNHLIDVAREMSRQIDAFPKLWNHLRECLSEREFTSLCAWLSRSSQLLAGKDVLGSN